MRVVFFYLPEDLWIYELPAFFMLPEMEWNVKDFMQKKLDALTQTMCENGAADLWRTENKL